MVCRVDDMLKMDFLVALTRSPVYFEHFYIWLHQLCNKFAKETMFNIWRNEKYFLVLLIYLSIVWLQLQQSKIKIYFFGNGRQKGECHQKIHF